MDNKNIIGIITLILMATLMLFACYKAFTFGNEVPRSTTINLAFDAFCIIICTVIFATTLIDQNISASTIIFMCILTLEELLLFWNIVSWIVDGDVSKIHLNKLSNYYSYGFQYIIVLTFWLYLKELYAKQKTAIRQLSRIIYILFAMAMLLILTNPWTGFYFTVSEVTGYYERGSAFILSYIMPYLMLFVCFYCIIRYENNTRRKLALLGYIIIPLCGAILQSINGKISLQVIFLMFAIVLMYTNIYIERSAELIANETKMSEQRAMVMVSQIQPHFLYNALTSIMNIKGNPEEVKDSIADFGKYMRGNLDSITQVNPIPISREVDQLEAYINLRKIRYGNSLNIDVNIHDLGFFIPPMTIKTIVDAAVRTHQDNKEFFLDCNIETRSDESNHIIVITDYFPVESVYAFINNEDNPHIAMLRERVSNMVNGTIRNEVEDDGVVHTIITIPRSKEVKG